MDKPLYLVTQLTDRRLAISDSIGTAGKPVLTVN